MATKNLGQVAAIVISATAPSNNYLIWFDLSSNSLKYYNFETSTWDSLSGASSIGQVKLTPSDSLGYLINKLDSTLTVSGGQLKVAIPVTLAEKAKWNGATTTYFVTNLSGLTILTPNAGDKAIVADDGDGKRAGYYWSGTDWIKDFDPDWENINLHWSNIVDIPSATTVTQGVIALANTSEILTGINATKAVTPSTLTDKIGVIAGKICAGNDSRLNNSRQCNNNFDNASTSRANLGLGNSATKNIGSSTNTVCAGDDNRLSDSRETKNITGQTIHIKILNIGDWNMSATSTVNIAHGLSSYTKIITTPTVLIRDDDFDNPSSAIPQLINFTPSGYISIKGSYIILTKIGTDWNSTFVSTGFNRGYIKIEYID